jgi:guanyl-specific ribonuclease Sa
LRIELARSTTLLALATSFPSSVTTLAVTTTATLTTTLTVATATAKWSALTVTTALTAHHASRGSVRSLLLDVCGGDDLGGEVQPLAEVVETLRGQGVVVVLPRELGLDITAGSE